MIRLMGCFCMFMASRYRFTFSMVQTFVPYSYVTSLSLSSSYRTDEHVNKMNLEAECPL